MGHVSDLARGEFEEALLNLPDQKAQIEAGVAVGEAVRQQPLQCELPQCPQVRCDALGALRDAVGAPLGPAEMNRAKAITRIGMGRCQGRFCGLAAAEIIAATRGVAVEQAGRLRVQAPVKPIALATVLEESAP